MNYQIQYDHVTKPQIYHIDFAFFHNNELYDIQPNNLFKLTNNMARYS